MYTYDRDIICLPKSELGKDGIIRIPRKKSVHDFLAMNKLIGKIHLTSDMSEGAVFTEIRSVFEGPMAGDPNFRFKILQTCGGGSKTLSAPVLSSSFKWTAGAVAGRNSKVPVYILAEDDLIVSYSHQGFFWDFFEGGGQGEIFCVASNYKSGVCSSMSHNLLYMYT